MRRVLLACFLPIVATASSCLGPTEIMVHVTTNACTTLTRVDMYVSGSSAPATSAPGCVDSTTGEVGYLAIVPSGAIDERVNIGVVGAIGDPCSTLDTKDAQCIVAKRSIAFAPHERLDMPIFLDSACAGLCTDSNTTCVADPAPHCVGTTCDGDGGLQCGGDAGGVPDALPIADVVGVFDTVLPPPTCVDLLKDAGVPQLIWSFDPHLDQLIHEDHDSVAAQQAINASITTTAPAFCGPYLKPKAAQTLVVSDKRLSTSNFKIAFAYRALADGTIVNLASQSQFGGYHISINTGLLEVWFTTSADLRIYQDSVKTTDGQWHVFAMSVVSAATDSGTSSTYASFSRDGAMPVSKAANFTAGSGGPFTVGPIDGIDQLEFF